MFGSGRCYCAGFSEPSSRKYLLSRAEFIAWHLKHRKMGNADVIKNFCDDCARVSIRALPTPGHKMILYLILPGGKLDEYQTNLYVTLGSKLHLRKEKKNMIKVCIVSNYLNRIKQILIKSPGREYIDCIPCKRLRTPPLKIGCHEYDIKLVQMVRLQLWSSGECGVLLHCHYSQIHSDRSGCAF